MFACHNSDTSVNPTELYLHDLQLYKYYPVGNFSLKELESICMQRLEVLLFVERIYLGTDLVETHKVFLKYGMAFVPEKELAGLCFGYFKENLAEGLESMPLVANDAVNDPRINKIFNMLTEYINKEKDIIKKNYVPSLSELDDMSKKSYPLCMRIIHEMLRKDHHLKYGERKQYSLFLKDIGVTSDDAMELWKQEFTKKINEATFEREYGYRLRHIYGEGNIRKTYTCLKCSSIINLNIKSTESYGCPFKHLTNASLTQKLNEYEFVLEDIEDIVKLSSMKNYEGAY
ncbi:DNA primase large subunit-like [Vespa mandarinia]|uniref:DNA primase large subunit-like n=1 Tax=Vespa mandarinia TaxID=7446 RepID=UPI00161C33C2|nr:DNA primase large subunit-like [Vespa mandarinia]